MAVLQGRGSLLDPGDQVSQDDPDHLLALSFQRDPLIQEHPEVTETMNIPRHCEQSNIVIQSDISHTYLCSFWTFFSLFSRFSQVALKNVFQTF